MPKKKVSGSRLGRLARLGWLSRRAVPVALERLRETARAAPEERGEVMARALDKHADIAEEALSTLGELKGVALKVGQMLSYMDGALPESYRPVYQKTLQKLQQSAPSLPWRAIEPVLVRELGAPVAERFVELEPEPFAAASIGQVHRGVLPDGAEVAVKIQYPGVDRAMRSDLGNATMFRALLAPVMGIMGGSRATRRYVKDVMDEVRARLLEELDYAHEARMQTRFRELLADEPDVVVPRVFESHSTARVLTTELIDGRPLETVCDEDDQAARDHYAEVLTRTLQRCLYRHGLFNGDPHPGNYLFLPEGRVCLLDFGCVKVVPEWMRVGLRRTVLAGIQATSSDDPADWAAFDRELTRALHLDPSDPQMFRLYREFTLTIMRPAMTPGAFHFTSRYSGESIDQVLDGAKEAVFGRGRLPRMPELPPVPPDYTLLNRLQWGFYSVLTMLDARVRWQELLLEQLGDDARA